MSKLCLKDGPDLGWESSAERVLFELKSAGTEGTNLINMRRRKVYLGERKPYASLEAGLSMAYSGNWKVARMNRGLTATPMREEH